MCLCNNIARMSESSTTSTKVFITGGNGFLGGKLVAQLAANPQFSVVAADIRDVTPERRLANIAYEIADVRDDSIAKAIAKHRPNVIVHLAAIVSPGRDSNRQIEYAVDVTGSQNVLAAAAANGVKRIVVSSSGAAYGYHADNPRWLNEDHPLRGNEVFAYAHHKRLVEEILAEYRLRRPQLEQVIFRVGTILGPTANNQITNLFEKPLLLGVTGGDDRFVFIWDDDVAACLERAITSATTGIFNVAGDGALTMGELAALMGKRYLRLPAGLLRAALSVGKPLGLTRYGPEQVAFLQYRPVLDNTRLKSQFGYTPQKTSAEAFAAWWRLRAAAT